MKRKAKIALIAGSLACALLPATVSISASDAAVRLEDFAYASHLSLEGKGAVYALPLPERVYAGVARPDLGDLRVFNGAGAVVPHELTRPGVPRRGDAPEIQLPFFPVYEDDRSADRVKLRVLRQGDESEMVIEHDDESSVRLVGYVLDARQLQRRVDRLRFQWSEPTADSGFLVRVRVQAGDDLDTWRPLVANAALADLTYLGRRLRRDKVAIPSSAAEFYRLDFDRPDQAVELGTALAREVSEHTPRPPTQWREVSVRPGAPGEYLFDIPDSMPVAALSVALPERNTLTRASVHTRTDAGQPWRPRATAQLYRLILGDTELTNPDLPLSGVAARHWRLTVDQAGGGIGSGLPTIRVGWTPHRLVFVARGEEPFTLAWGSARIAPLRLEGVGLGRDLEGNGVSALTASLGNEQLSPGGSEVLAPRTDWRRVLLWGVLIVGALVLVGMAVRLLRQMDV